MADKYGTDVNSLTFHIIEQCLDYIPNIKVEEIDEKIIKTETEVSGGSWVYQNVDINENQNLKNSEKQLLNENTGVKKDAFEDDIWQTINNSSTNLQKNNESGLDFDNGNMDFDGEEKVFQQDLIEDVKINKKEKLQFLHDDNDCRCTGTLKEKVLVFQKKCGKDVVLNYAKDKKQTAKRNNYNATEKKYKCNECSYAAVRKYDLPLHVQACHTMEKHFQCNECSYAAVNKSNLLCHIKSRHTMEKPYKCNECSYAAVQKRNLLFHIQSHHTMEKPYKCNECSYTTVRKQTFLFHIKTYHTMEKPYKCNECSYAAVNKFNLLSHVKCHHTMEKPYKCNECSYATVRKHDLLLHNRSRHTMEKLYKCNECSYAAVNKSNLVSHIKSHHTMEKPHKCNECSYSSVKKCNLLYHIKSHRTLQ